MKSEKVCVCVKDQACVSHVQWWSILRASQSQFGPLLITLQATILLPAGWAGYKGASCLNPGNSPKNLTLL